VNSEKTSEISIKGTNRLGGRRILITGGASGIGRATAELFKSEGAQLAILDVDPVGVKIIAESLSVTGIECDVSNEASVSESVQTAARAMGGIDGIVNSAGMATIRAFADLDFQTMQREIAVNLLGPFLICRAALKWLRETEMSTIVNIASGQAFLPFPGSVAYATSKGGVVSMTRALAAELAPLIRVNAVCPGSVDTPMTRKSTAGTTKSHAADRYALKRVADPSEISNALLFLTSAESSFVTGATLAVDGGRTYH